jgi:hypothetical protein
MTLRDERGQFIQGPEAARRFETTMNRLLSVSKEELAKREADYREARKGKANPGPKPTAK